MRIPLDIRLESARCYLRAVSSEDVDCVWTASRVEGFTDGMTWDPPETVDQIHEATERTIEKWQQGNDFTFSICLNESDECIGRIVIRKTDRADIWDIGYWLHPNFQGKGYMSEAAERIIEFGFLDLQAQSIESAHALWNEGSGKVLLNAGFGYVRNNPEGFLKHGNWIEEKEYVLKKEDWMRNHQIS